MTLTARPVTMPDEADSNPELPPTLALAVAPLHKRAFGVAVGLASGASVAGVTLLYLVLGRPAEINLGLLNQYFWGYSATWSGVIVGLWWGFIAGFVAGWFLAFCRNTAIAISIFLIRTRSQLSNTRDFLDHI